MRPILEEINGLICALGTDGIKFLDLDEIAANGIPEPDWIIPQWVAHGDIIVCAGGAGGGKSTLIVDLGVSIASGRSWCGIKPSTTGHVIYCDEEAGFADIGRQCIRQGAAGFPNFHVSSCIGLRLDEPESVSLVEHSIAKWTPLLVVLDTATQFFAGADENSSGDVVERFRHLIRLRDSYRCAFVIIHHLRKPQAGRYDMLDRVRGSTAFTTLPNAVWSLVRTRHKSAADLTAEKRRGCPRSTMRIEYVEVGDYIELRSLKAPEASRTRLESASSFVIDYLGDVEEAKTSDIVAAAEEKGHSKRTTNRAISDLVEDGRLERRTHGLYKLRPPLDVRRAE